MIVFFFWKLEEDLDKVFSEYDFSVDVSSEEGSEGEGDDDDNEEGKVLGSFYCVF